MIEASSNAKDSNGDGVIADGGTPTAGGGVPAWPAIIQQFQLLNSSAPRGPGIRAALG